MFYFFSFRGQKIFHPYTPFDYFREGSKETNDYHGKESSIRSRQWFSFLKLRTVIRLSPTPLHRGTQKSQKLLLVIVKVKEV